MLENVLKLTERLCELDGVSGTEKPVAEFIRAHAERHADQVRTDVLGNIIAVKKGARKPSKSLLLSAHMDEVGLIITNITEDGYLRFGEVGGIDRRVLMGKTVYVGPNRVFGVIGSRAVHLMSGEEREKIPPTREMYIDIGAKSKEEAEKLVSLADTAVFGGEPAYLSGKLLKARALDDRLGCAVLMTLMEKDLPVDCTFVFTVQEEVGNRGAFGASFSVAPDIALIVETATCADLPSVAEHQRVTRLGRGVVIPFMDRGTVYSRELYGLLTGLAEKNGIPWQTKTSVAGGTDAAAVQRARGGVLTAAVAAPVRNLHSPAPVASVEDIENLYKLCALFLEEIGERY